MNMNPSHRRASVDPNSSRTLCTRKPKPPILLSIGIGLIGLGIGAIAAPYLGSSATMIALLGLALFLIALIHAARERQAHPWSAEPVWMNVIYASCWIIILVLLFSLLEGWLFSAG